MAKKMRLQFSGFEEMAERLDKLGGDLKKTTEKALEATHDYITPKVEQAFKEHDIKYSHETGKSIIKNGAVEWNGAIASIGVGFKVSNGGLPSIFLMYGTPRIPADTDLFNSVYGSKTKREVKALQEQIFTEAIKKQYEG